MDEDKLSAIVTAHTDQIKAAMEQYHDEVGTGACIDCPRIRLNAVAYVANALGLVYASGGDHGPIMIGPREMMNGTHVVTIVPGG